MTNTGLMKMDSTGEKLYAETSDDVEPRPSSEFDPANDSYLIAETLAGDPDAFACLIRPHLDRFTTGIRRILQDDQDTQDALQGALHSIHSGLRCFAGNIKFRKWAYRICLEEALTLRRSRMRRGEEIAEDFMARFFCTDPLADTGCSDPGFSAFQGREFLKTIREGLAHISDDHRVVFILRDIEGLDTDDVARKLRVTRGYVRKHLHEARVGLQSLLPRSSDRQVPA